MALCSSLLRDRASIILDTQNRGMKSAVGRHTGRFTGQSFCFVVYVQNTRVRAFDNVALAKRKVD